VAKQGEWLRDCSPARRMMLLRDVARAVARCRPNRTITVADVAAALVRFGAVKVPRSIFRSTFPCSGAEWDRVDSTHWRLRWG